MERIEKKDYDEIKKHVGAVRRHVEYLRQNVNLIEGMIFDISGVKETDLELLNELKESARRIERAWIKWDEKINKL